MKKAQQIGQVFIYVLTLVIVSGVLVFGYNAISNFQESSSKVSILKLQTDMQKAVENLASDFGSVSLKSFAVPGYTQLCMVTSFEPIAGIPAGIATQFPIIADSVQSNAEQNMFLIESGVVGEEFYVPNIEIATDAVCLPIVGGSVSLKLEGRGDRVLISVP